MAFSSSIGRPLRSTRRRSYSDMTDERCNGHTQTKGRLLRLNSWPHRPRTHDVRAHNPQHDLHHQHHHHHRPTVAGGRRRTQLLDDRTQLEVRCDESSEAESHGRLRLRRHDRLFVHSHFSTVRLWSGLTSSVSSPLLQHLGRGVPRSAPHSYHANTLTAPQHYPPLPHSQRTPCQPLDPSLPPPSPPNNLPSPPLTTHPLPTSVPLVAAVVFPPAPPTPSGAAAAAAATCPPASAPPSSPPGPPHPSPTDPPLLRPPLRPPIPPSPRAYLTPTTPLLPPPSPLTCPSTRMRWTTT